MTFRPARAVQRIVRLPAVLLLGAAAASFGCSKPHENAGGMQVEVQADGKRPIAGAQLRVRGDYLGTTDALGQATLRVPGEEGERLPVSLTCPDGFVADPPQSILVWSEHGAAPALSLNCRTEQREAVVLVHAGGAVPSLPVKVDGVVVGRTDSLGFAHLHVRTNPESTFEVTLDTSGNDGLLPANPTRQFRLERSDEIFVFDAALEQPPRNKRRSGAKRRPRAKKQAEPSP
jgi:hypothetical protein